jgi:hypothetical protein
LPETVDFRNRLRDEVSGAAGALARIDTLCLSYFDSATGALNDRVCVSVAPGDFAVDVGARKLRLSKSLTYGGTTAVSYNRIVVKSGAVTYFVTTVTEGTLSPGASVSVVWELTISGSVSATGVFTSGSVDLMIAMILRALAGQRGAKDSLVISRFSYLDTIVSPARVLLALTPSISVDGMKVRAVHDFVNFTSSGVLAECWVLNDKRAGDADSEAVLVKLVNPARQTVDSSMSIKHLLELSF